MSVLDRSSDAPGAPVFPGVGAPLNLPDLTAEESASILNRFLSGTFGDWAEAAEGVKYCVCPIRLTGSSETRDAATGEVLKTFSSADAPLGALFIACGNRRAAVCPSCSRLYSRDTYELIRAGVLGGKTVPEAVTNNPLLFVTFTAPGFGQVHRHHATKAKRPKRCMPRDAPNLCPHGRPMACMAVHGENDPVVGSPLCWDCYDWESAAVWNWWSPELWRRFTIALRRELADRLGVKESLLREVASLQYAKVAEYQARGSVHFHALIRLDGWEPKWEKGARTLANPSPLTADELIACVEAAAAHVSFTAPPVDAQDIPRILHWGEQLDIQTVRGTPSGSVGEVLTPSQVAGYVAKYASKDAVSKHNPATAPPHLQRLMGTCLDLDARHRREYGDDVDGKDSYGLLRKWSHALGFRGHFSTKSRKYSVSLTALRRARARFAVILADAQASGKPIDTRDLEARLLAEDDEETTLVVGSWTFDGSGWPEPGDPALAASAAARARQWSQWKAHERKAA